MTTATAPTTELAIPDEPHQFLPVAPAVGTDGSILMDPQAFEHIQRVAKVYAAAKLVPDHYRGSIADCVIALEMSHRLGVNPFMFLQNTYMIQGKPGMEAKLAIALVNKRGPFAGPIQYRFEGEGKTRSCTAFARHKNGETCEATVDWNLVQAEGWDKKSGSKWKTMPDQMFRYRAAMFLARAYCPEVLMGMQTVEELADVYGHTRYIDSTATSQGSASDGLNAALQLDDPDDANPSPDAENADAREGEAGTDDQDGAWPSTPWQRLVQQLADQCDCTIEGATDKIVAFVAKVYKADVSELTEGQYADIATKIDQGDLAL